MHNNAMHMMHMMNLRRSEVQVEATAFSWFLVSEFEISVFLISSNLPCPSDTHQRFHQHFSYVLNVVDKHLG